VSSSDDQRLLAVAGRPTLQGCRVRRGQKHDGEHGKAADAEAVAERSAGNGAERGEGDQDARPNPGAGGDADRDRWESNAAA